LWFARTHFKSGFSLIFGSHRLRCFLSLFAEIFCHGQNHVQQNFFWYRTSHNSGSNGWSSRQCFNNCCFQCRWFGQPALWDASTGCTSCRIEGHQIPNQQTLQPKFFFVILLPNQILSAKQNGAKFCSPISKNMV